MSQRLKSNASVVVATHNPGKRVEMGALLAPYAVRVMAAGELGLAEPEETAADFSGNARLKAVAAAAAIGLPALADDSGFCLAALGGRPGVLSARIAGPGKDFAGAMAGLATEAEGSGDRRAWFVCALCLAWPEGETASFLGRVDGHWVWPGRGTLGFGYDPMFVALGQEATFGEMAPAGKEAISHRARAFAQFAAACLPALPSAAGGPR